MIPKFRTTIAPVAAVLATAAFATSATARPIDPTPQPARTNPTYQLPRDFTTADVRDAARDGTWPDTAGRQDLRMPDTVDAAAGRGTFNAPEVTVIKVPQPAPSSQSGVEWADAAIGAGAATGLLAISLAGVMTLRRRRSTPRVRAAIS
jgi:hypothetical protein